MQKCGDRLASRLVGAVCRITLRGEERLGMIIEASRRQVNATTFNTSQFHLLGPHIVDCRCRRPARDMLTATA